MFILKELSWVPTWIISQWSGCYIKADVKEEAGRGEKLVYFYVWPNSYNWDEGFLYIVVETELLTRFVDSSWPWVACFFLAVT